MTDSTVRVLFVCLGNICRSPLAEGVFRALVREAGVEDRFFIDSAGTADYHVGDLPDPRTREVARRRGIQLTSRARQVQVEDLETFDYVIAMDSQNLRDVRRLAARAQLRAEIRRLREFDEANGGDLDVPDPYYGGPAGFELVHDIVERSCRRFLDSILAPRMP